MNMQYQPNNNSYVLRKGRMTSLQKVAIKNLSKYNIELPLEENGSLISKNSLFNNEHPVVLEIGFGMGDSLIQSAINHPDFNFIGADPYPPGIGALISKIESFNLQNIKILQGDAIKLLNKIDFQFDRVQIFFPDPWPKKRHHKRRLISLDFLNFINNKIIKGGVLHIATDWENYYLGIMEAIELSSFKIIKNDTDNNQYNNQFPELKSALLIKRYDSKYQQKAIREGRTINDIILTNSTQID